MRLLLDTHTLLWADAEPSRLSKTAQSLVHDVENELLLSCASLWEMQIKVMLGKLTVRRPLPELVNEWVTALCRSAGCGCNYWKSCGHQTYSAT